MAALFVTGTVTVAFAQTYERPPADIEQRGDYAGGDADASIRVDRLESQVRTLNGQVEQLQHQVKVLEDTLHRFQSDVDARFQEHGGSRQSAVPPSRTEMPEQAQAPQSDAESLPPATARSEGRRRDAFDPSVQSQAPGAPKALGSLDSASKALPSRAGRDPSAPLDINPPGLNPPSLNPPSLENAPTTQTAILQPGSAPSIDPVKGDFETAEDLLRAQRYDAAQQAFSTFLQKHPGTRFNAPAIYHYGESFYYQNRYREAAEQFLKIATDYSRSLIAPGAMVKLGVSLNALGAKEQACAFFAEVPRKYPHASAAEKQAASREAKKAAC
jgi:tol-pal system protein YbgF